LRARLARRWQRFETFLRELDLKSPDPPRPAVLVTPGGVAEADPVPWHSSAAWQGAIFAVTGKPPLVRAV
jgi:hypothetical protein